MYFTIHNPYKSLPVTKYSKTGLKEKFLKNLLQIKLLEHIYILENFLISNVFKDVKVVKVCCSNGVNSLWPSTMI